MSTTTHEYSSLRIKGPLSVVPVTPAEVKRKHSLVYILMGPTGSGRSAFIQALSPDRDLGISRDSIESVTPNVAYYRVANLKNPWGYECTLMDTPGFLDTELSESRITEMILSKLDDIRKFEEWKGLSAPLIFVTILYFQPIVDTRMAGSKIDAFRLLKVFAESFNIQGITVVTTMWNRLSTPQRIEEANRRFNILKDEVFAPSDKFWIELTKFTFSTDSALSCLDASYWGLNLNERMAKNTNPLYQSLFRTSIIHRIINTHQQLQVLAEDKHNVSTARRKDPHLLEVILRGERAVLMALHSFLDNLYKIDPSCCSSHLPPLSFRVALQCRLRRIVATGRKFFYKSK